MKSVLDFAMDFNDILLSQRLCLPIVICVVTKMRNPNPLDYIP